jgi:hypothetical protein
LLGQLQSRLIEAASKKSARRSRSMPRKIDFTVESFDSPKLRAVQVHHRSLQKQRVGRPRGMQLRQRGAPPHASRSIDDGDDDDDSDENDGIDAEGAGSSDDEDDDDLLDDGDDEDDNVVASVTPIASTPIRSGVDRDHGPTAASVFVDFVLFFCGAAAIVIGGGRLLDLAFGEKIFNLP